MQKKMESACWAAHVPFLGIVIFLEASDTVQMPLAVDNPYPFLCHSSAAVLKNASWGCLSVMELAFMLSELKSSVALRVRYTLDPVSFSTHTTPTHTQTHTLSHSRTLLQV